MNRRTQMMILYCEVRDVGEGEGKGEEWGRPCLSTIRRHRLVRPWLVWSQGAAKSNRMLLPTNRTISALLALWPPPIVPATKPTVVKSPAKGDQERAALEHELMLVQCGRKRLGHPGNCQDNNLRGWLASSIQYLNHPCCSRDRIRSRMVWQSPQNTVRITEYGVACIFSFPC